MPYIGMNQDTPYGRYLRSHGNRGFDWRMAAPVAGIAALPAIGALLGGGAAASAAPAASGSSFWGGVTAPTFGASAAGASAPAVTAGASGMTFGNLLKLGELGTGLTTQLIGQRQQNRALDRDALMRSNEFQQQMALVQAQNAEAKRQWDAEQLQKANEYARVTRLEDEREARRANYRQTIGDPALLRLRDLLRLGGR